jgi:hypothetical protein
MRRITTTVDQCDTADMIGDNDGAMLWTKLISQYANVSLVLSGHITNKFANRRSDVGVNGNFVHQIFANYQDSTNGGNGYLRIMKFSPSNNTIRVQATRLTPGCSGPMRRISSRSSGIMTAPLKQKQRRLLEAYAHRVTD